MKKKIITFIFILLIVQVVEGQIKPELRKYFYLINQAELKMVDNDYKKALYFFKKAFLVNKKSFGKDYYNACVCGALAGKKSVAIKLMKKLISKGVSLSFFERKDIFNGIVVANRRALAKISPIKIDTQLKERLELLYQKDQLLRGRSDSYTTLDDTIKKIDAGNVSELLEIINDFGFPDESHIGLNDTLNLSLPHYIVIRHQTPPYQIYNFTDILTKASKEGKLLPYIASYLIDLVSGQDIYGFPIIFRVVDQKDMTFEDFIDDKKYEAMVSQSKWVYRNLSQENELRINNNRYEIGLESITDYRKKLIFSLSNKYFLFYNEGGTATFFSKDSLSIQKLLRNTTIIR